MSAVMTKEQVAAKLGVSVRTIERADIPKIRVGTKRVLYSEASVDAWLASRTVTKAAA